MCLILLSYEMHPKYRMVLAANRDEYFNRPTAPIAFHDDSSDVLGGRDLQHHGMWLGITRFGRFAAITNYRDPGLNISNAPSRGFLVRDFLTGKVSPDNYLEHV
ncbi:MAG: NRDE family protein, partial [Desulfobacteraceae bacterium]|nr:NRDE family protein [Desulfobacteraceae bacterium]